MCIRDSHNVGGLPEDLQFELVEPLDWEFLMHVTQRILNEVPNINRVCYDISPKPSATIEWE